MLRDEVIAKRAKEERYKIEQDAQIELEERIRESVEVENIINQGKISKRFIESELGRFILDRATEEERRAKEALAIIDPEEYKTSEKYIFAVKELQMRAHIPSLLFTWLSEAIRAAKEISITINQEIYDDGTTNGY